MEKRSGQVFTPLHPWQCKKSYTPLESEVQVDVELNRPTATGRTDWTIRKAKIPGILMVFSASMNLVAFSVIIVVDAFFSEFMIACLIYLTTGVLAIVGAFKVQSTQVVTLATLIMACISLNLVGAQLLLRLFDLGIGRGLAEIPIGSQVSQQIIYWTHVVLLFNSFLTLAVCIALVFIGSKVICQCCGGGDQGDDGARQDAAVIPGGEFESQVPFLSID
ncbi:uncharacterized protein LOC135488103 [Lineus longissimus]|uniref:uncharacterized protein LOC135488103 n=1 Tax=Lineus longissimus TaxID=88925 RepID=UPI002B4D33B8